MRERERERKKNNTEKVHRTNNVGSEVKEKEKAFSEHAQKAFSEHTQKAFSALRDARGVGVAGVGVVCRAWLGVGLVVVVAMSLSLFTEHAG